MRLLIHVEGQTEESFVNEVLSEYLVGLGYSVVSARLMGNSRQRHRRGGVRSWPTVRKGIVTHLKSDPGCLATTMADYYGLPQKGAGAWPGRREATRLPVKQRAEHVETACINAVDQEFGSNLARRFVPFVMMHEFEALLFSDCRRFAEGIGRQNAYLDLQQIRDQFATPEEIDDSPETAPSKRVEAVFPQYQKPLMGTLASLEIGIPTMLAECPHFATWLDRLANLASGQDRGQR